MKFEDIQKSWTSDCNIDDTELAKESVRIPQLHNKYLILYSNEKLILKTLRYDHSKLVKLKKEYYGGRLSGEELEALDWEPFQHRLLKQDIDAYIEADEDAIESKQKMSLHEEKVDYLEAVVKSLTTRGYLIKNAIDWKRFTEGH